MKKITDIWNVVIGTSAEVDIVYQDGMTIYSPDKIDLAEAIEDIRDHLDCCRQEMYSTFEQAELGKPVVHQYVCDLRQLIECDKHLDDY